MNVLVLSPYLYDTAPGQRFRIEQWARALEEVRFTFVPFESPALKQVWHAQRQYLTKATELARSIRRRVAMIAGLDGSWDAIIIHRELMPVGPAVLERWLAKRGIPILYDFDDAIFLPDVSEANRRFQWLKWPGKTGDICRLSAHVIVGNDYLKQYALRHTGHVTVIPTTIDTQHYTPKASNDITGTPVIGWSGSRTTVKHLRSLEPALRELRRLMEFRLAVIGGDGRGVSGIEVEHRPWNAEGEVADLHSFDVGIMPLPDDAWTRGKCGLKALQYMAAGIPTVASPVGVNAAFIEDGCNGFLAASQGEWVEKLARLLSDSELRRRFAAEGRRTVEARYSAREQAPRFRDLLRRISLQDERARELAHR
jgi:glycosyltransferase involved in cell wall biosynthesis